VESDWLSGRSLPMLLSCCSVWFSQVGEMENCVWAAVTMSNNLSSHSYLCFVYESLYIAF